MVQPLFFEPDPGIPDSDLLGYGDLIYDDGTREFISGDPELASMFPRQDNGLAQYEPDPLADIPLPEFEPLADEPVESSIQPIPGTDAMVDISTGQIDVGGGSLGEPPPERVGTTEVTHRLGERLQPIPGTDASVDISTGEIMPGGGGQMPAAGPPPDVGYGSGGMVPVQREGALPPQIAQQQQLELEQQNLAQYQAMEQQRAQELQIYRQAALQRQGQLDAEQQALRAQQQEQQQKLQRWQEEQKLTAEMDIKTDLVSAQGTLGAIMSIVGAGMFGLVGSDAGLRMIDSSIDQHVRKQVSQRDSRLRVLADRIGSTEQAIAAGKAELYKIAAERVETTQKLTQADVFEQQTPVLLQELRAKQLANEQRQQEISLGKTTERLPQPAKQSAGQLAAQMKYGKAAAEQESTENEIMRAANQLGLKGWNAETGKFENRDKLLETNDGFFKKLFADDKLPGIGRQDSFAQNNRDIPIIGQAGKAFDELATSDKGLANRAALESLANAEAARINPGKAPSDADRESAKRSLGTLTEAGAVEAIERLMKWQETQRAQNLSIYGPEAAAPYEQRRDATGVPRAQVVSGDNGEQLQEGSAREQIAAYRAQRGSDAPQLTGSYRVKANGDPAEPRAATAEARMAELSDFVVGIAGRELPPEGVEILMAQAGHETADGSKAPGNNMFGHKANKAGRSTGEQALMTNEGEGAAQVRTRERFAMFDSIGDSVADHVDLLKRRYPDAWAALMEGDSARYVAALKDGGYFTGNETTYLNQILARLGSRQSEMDQSMESGL